MIMNYSKAHEAFLNQMGQAPPSGRLENEFSQNTIVRLFLLPIILILSQIFSNVSLAIHKHELRLEDLGQHLYSLWKFHAIFAYPVSNQRAHHGWAQRKIFTRTVPRWQENSGTTSALISVALSYNITRILYEHSSSTIQRDGSKYMHKHRATSS